MRKTGYISRPDKVHINLQITGNNKAPATERLQGLYLKGQA
jgi:hypothetical protein